ncbi:MAG: SdpI family protein [Gordonia sp. (in: high G+C Gram-positive bacteria)]|uniref:SdpI family protein n=1 Tax=Gordonia sp. (in: high G+C Gram-positive bacteria) TaxID=84139 RepID=UPI003BB6291A
MYAASVIAAVVAFVLAALWAGVGIAGLLGRLPGNRWIGVRSKATRASQDAWDLAHRVAAPGFLFGSLALILGGALALTTEWGFLFALGGLAIGLLAVSVVSGVAVRAAQRVPAPEGAGGCSSDCCSGGTVAAEQDSCAANSEAQNAADCGESSCGSCALSGMCESESPPASAGR